MPSIIWSYYAGLECNLLPTEFFFYEQAASKHYHHRRMDGIEVSSLVNLCNSTGETNHKSLDIINGQRRPNSLVGNRVYTC